MRFVRCFALVVVVVFLIVCANLCVADRYPTFNELASEFDERAHLEIGGPNGINFITSGPDYDRVQEIVKKLGCKKEVFLVNSQSFNAAASASRIYVNLGTVNRCNDNMLAPVIGHEMAHIFLSHLQNQYDQKVAIAEQVDRSVAIMNKPGYEENAKLASKIGKVVISLSSLHYSREDEYQADANGFISAENAGYDVVGEGIKIFDLMSNGYKGVLGNLSTHPASESRKERVLQTLAKNKANQIALNKANEAAKKIEIVDSIDLAKAVRDKNFAAYAYRSLIKGDFLWLICSGKGELQYDKKVGAIKFPAGTKEAYLVGINPKPANFFGNLRIIIENEFEYQVVLDMTTTNPHIDGFAFKIPVEFFQPGQIYRFMLFFGKKPLAEGVAPSRNDDLAIRDCSLKFEKDQSDIADEYKQ